MVVEPDREARDRAVRGLGRGSAVAAQVLTTELLRQARPQAVVIASPSGLHFEHVKLSLNCGLPTYVEKPAAGTARAVQELCGRSRGLLAIAEQRRYRRDLRLARSFIEIGELGEIRRIAYRDLVAPAPEFGSTWRNDPVLAGGGVLLDLGYHTVGAVLWLLGQTAGDFSIASALLHDGGFRVDTRAEVSGSFGSTEIQLEIGLDAIEPREQLTVTGSRGEVRVERYRADGDSSVISLTKPGSSDRRLSVRLGNYHDAKSLRDFIRAVPDARILANQATIMRSIDQIYLCAGKAEEFSACR
jgi:predicted dehydrogenase